MIANKMMNVVMKQPMSMAFMFSTKKKQMELTIKTPYQTITESFTGFTRIITKTQQSTLVIQNRTPPALHILPPGYLKLKLNGEAKGVADEYMHTGGWLIVHTQNLQQSSDNTCEINLMDAAEKKDIRPDQIDKVDIKDADNLTGKYVSKARKMVSKTFAKRALQ